MWAVQMPRCSVLAVVRTADPALKGLTRVSVGDTAGDDVVVARCEEGRMGDPVVARSWLGPFGPMAGHWALDAGRRTLEERSVAPWGH